MLDYCAARAPEYGNVYLKPERQSDLRAIKHWISNRFSGSTVIEVACGTGCWTQFFAPVAAYVLAIDAAPETLRIAKTQSGTNHVDFVVGDAYLLPVTASKFDAAFAGFWLSHVPKQRLPEFLLSLHKTLRPNAKVVFLDNRFVKDSSSPISEPDAEGDTYQTRLLDNGTAYRVLKNFLTEQELQVLVNNLGSQVVYTEWQHY